MTSVPAPYRIGAESITAPKGMTAFMLAVATASLLEAIAAVWPLVKRLSAGESLALWQWLLAVVLGAGIVVVAGSLAMALVKLRASASDAVTPVARLLRGSIYLALVSGVMTMSWESQWFAGAGTLISVARGLIVLSAPVALLIYLGRAAAVGRAYGKSFGPRVADRQTRSLTRDGAMVILLMLAALVGVLFHASIPSFKAFGVGFLISREWRPNELEQPMVGSDGSVVIEDGEVVMQTIPPAFGALPVIYGTAVSSAIALGIAVPLSLGAALFLTRIAPRKLGAPVSFLIEFLAAIPSIAYGIWGLFVLAPFLQRYLEPAIRSALGGIAGLGWMFQQTVRIGDSTLVRPLPLVGRDMFAGELILAIMILPIITAIARDVLKAVPRAQIEGTLALGATWWQSAWEMLRYSRSGLFGAVMLGLARAAGETMAITMVIGNNNQIVASPFAAAQTMSSLLANEFAEASHELHRSALVQVALILLAMSLAFNIVARSLVVGRSSRSAAGH